MSRIISVLILLFSFCHSDHMKWVGSYDKALELARQENKPLMVLVVKKKCQLCQEIIKNVFMSHQDIPLFNKEIVPVVVIYEGKSTYPIELFYTVVFPTLFFVDSHTENFLHIPLYAQEIQKNHVLGIIKGLK